MKRLFRHVWNIPSIQCCINFLREPPSAMLHGQPRDLFRGLPVFEEYKRLTIYLFCSQPVERLTISRRSSISYPCFPVVLTQEEICEYFKSFIPQYSKQQCCLLNTRFFSQVCWELSQVHQGRAHPIASARSKAVEGALRQTLPQAPATPLGKRVP